MRAPHLPCVALALALCPVVVWGCGSDGPVLPPPDAGRPRNETCLALPPPPDAGRVRLERVYATSLSGNAAQKLTHVILPGADHPGFVTRQSGRVMSFTAADDAAGTVVLALMFAVAIYWMYDTNFQGIRDLHPKTGREATAKGEHEAQVGPIEVERTPPVATAYTDDQPVGIAARRHQGRGILAHDGSQHATLVGQFLRRQSKLQDRTAIDAVGWPVVGDQAEQPACGEREDAVRRVQER